MTRISDVAANAGVSTATVSRALNGKTTVDPELAEHVRTVADELGYRPNRPARNLRQQRSAVLALLISDVENQFFTSIARGAEDVAHEAGYSVVLCNSDDDPIKEREYVDVALQERVAGVLASPSGRRGVFEPLLRSGVPVVAVDRPLRATPTDAVLVDGHSAAAEATRHLVDQGFQRIGCVTGPRGVPTAEDRVAGYRHVLRDAGMPVSNRLVRRCAFRGTDARAACRGLLRRSDAPDALLLANNALLVGALEALTELGLRPGVDMGLVAFDDPSWVRLLRTPLSVVTQPAYDMGAIAARQLLRRIDGADPASASTTLSARLIVRESSLRT